MKIYCNVTRRPAQKIKGPNDPVAVYKCFPPGGKKNLDANAVKFERIEGAAQYLRSVSGGGIRVGKIGDAKGQGSAILNKNLVIEHNDGRKEFI